MYKIVWTCSRLRPPPNPDILLSRFLLSTPPKSGFLGGLIVSVIVLRDYTLRLALNQNPCIIILLMRNR